MRVRVYAALRPIVGDRVVEVGDAPTVEALLRRLVAAYPALAGYLIDDAGAVRPHAVILVSGRDIRHLDGVATALDAGSEVDIFPPVAGGVA